MKLYSYWRSSAAFRVRIGLNLKKIAYETAALDLVGGGHKTPEYLAENPQGLVPSLALDGNVIGQSGAILEYLEEQYPENPCFLPTRWTALVSASLLELSRATYTR